MIEGEEEEEGRRCEKEADDQSDFRGERSYGRRAIKVSQARCGHL